MDKKNKKSGVGGSVRGEDRPSQPDRGALKASFMMFGMGRVKEAMEIQAELARNSIDPRVRQKASQFMIDHDFRVFEHDNPAKNKLDITTAGEKLPTAINISFVDSETK